MDNQYIIGIDIGTTNIKGSLYSSEGEFISSHNISYNSYVSIDGCYEQDPEDWINGLFKIIQKLTVKKIVKKNIEAIAISTQGGTIVPVNKKYKPLTKAITWLDRRAVNLLKDNKNLLKKNSEIYMKTGWRLDSNMSFMPLYWLKINRPNIFKRIYKIFYVNDYIYRRITGQNFQDFSNASMTLFFNTRNGNWDKDILELLKLKESNFSEIKKSGDIIGYLNDNLCKKLNIYKKVKVINGGHDQHCSGLGAGILNDEEILLSTGTAWVIFKVLKNTLFDKRNFFSIGRSLLNKYPYSLICSIPCAGASLEWLASNLMAMHSRKDLYKLINNNREKLLQIKNPILFYPYLTGSYGPDFNIEKKASFNCIEINSNSLDFVKAIMEGVGFQLGIMFKVLKKRGIKIKKIKMVGGATRSTLWPQIISNITDCEILIPKNKNEDFASRGAAILAGYGAGLFSSLKEGYYRLKASFEIIKPKRSATDYYKNKMGKFIKCNSSINSILNVSHKEKSEKKLN